MGPAQAADDWGTMTEMESAKLQACKVSADGGDAWKVKLRVRNGNDYRVKGIGQVYKGGEPTNREWNSRWVRSGDSSAVGSVTMPRGPRFELLHGISFGEGGNGGMSSASGIGRC